MGNRIGQNPYKYYQPSLSQIDQYSIPYSTHPSFQLNQQNYKYDQSHFFPYQHYTNISPSISHDQSQQKRAIQQRNMNILANSKVDQKLNIQNPDNLRARSQIFNPNRLSTVNTETNINNPLIRKYHTEFYPKSTILPQFANAGNSYSLANSQKGSNISSKIQNTYSQFNYSPYQPQRNSSHESYSMNQSFGRVGSSNNQNRSNVNSDIKNMNKSSEILTQPKVTMSLIDSVHEPNPLNKSTWSNVRTTNPTSKQQILKQSAISKQINKYTEMIKSNLNQMKDKYDAMARNNEEQLFNIMEFINQQNSSRFTNEQKLIFLLVVKRDYQKSIIEIRLKQQKLYKIISAINICTLPAEINSLVDKSIRDLMVFSQSVVNWRSIMISTRESQFNRIVRSGKSDPEIMLAYNKMTNQTLIIPSNLTANTSCLATPFVTTQITTIPPLPPFSHPLPEPLPQTIMQSSRIRSQISNSIKSNQTARFGGSDEFNLNSSRISNNNNNNNIIINENQFTLNIVPQHTSKINQSFNKDKNKINIDNQVIDLGKYQLASHLESKVKVPSQGQAFVPILPTSGHFRR